MQRPLSFDPEVQAGHMEWMRSMVGRWEDCLTRVRQTTGTLHFSIEFVVVLYNLTVNSVGRRTTGNDVSNPIGEISPCHQRPNPPCVEFGCFTRLVHFLRFPMNFFNTRSTDDEWENDTIALTFLATVSFWGDIYCVTVWIQTTSATLYCQSPPQFASNNPSTASNRSQASLVENDSI